MLLRLLLLTGFLLPTSTAQIPLPHWYRKWVAQQAIDNPKPQIPAPDGIVYDGYQQQIRTMLRDLILDVGDDAWQDVHRLIREGGTPEMFITEDFTMLHYASRQGYLNLVRTLENAGADFSSLAKGVFEGMNALHFAVEGEHLDVVELILSNNGHDLDNDGEDDEDYEEENEDYEQENEHTKTKDKDLYSSKLYAHKDKDGNTPLTLAIKRKNSDVIFALLSHGASVNDVTVNTLRQDLLDIFTKRMFDAVQNNQKKDVQKLHSFGVPCCSLSMKTEKEQVDLGEQTMTTLEMSIYLKMDDMTSFLEQLNVDEKEENILNETPFSIAKEKIPTPPWLLKWIGVFCLTIVSVLLPAFGCSVLIGGENSVGKKGKGNEKKGKKKRKK